MKLEKLQNKIIEHTIIGIYMASQHIAKTVPKIDKS